MNQSEKVKILGCDGEVFEVDREAAFKSVFIERQIDIYGTEEAIEVGAFKRPILEKVFLFCEHIKDHDPPEIEKPLKSTDIASCVDQWYAQYIDLEHEIILELIMAADFLNIKPLLELAAAKVASLIKNKTVPEIRQFFNIENDFTPEEEAQIMEENKWAEQSF